MLIDTTRPTAEDRRRFAAEMRACARYARYPQHEEVVDRAADELAAFTSRGGGYVGVSWGKDSVVLAHMSTEVCPTWPLVWVRVEPILNPDCMLVRDVFLSTHPGCRYEEVVVWCERSGGQWHATGTLERGFADAAGRYGDRYASGIRGDESAQRGRRVARYGLSTARTCAPLGRWSSADVFAYLQAYDLPIHPAYACLMDGMLDPGRVRVASLGGQRGTGRGRAEWERRYYGDELRCIDEVQPCA